MFRDLQKLDKARSLLLLLVAGLTVVAMPLRGYADKGDLENVPVEDVIAETGRRIAESKVAAPEAVRALGRPLAVFSETMRQNDIGLKRFLFAHMYRHARVTRMTEQAKVVVASLFERHLAEPTLLPQDWRPETGAAGDAKTARVVADYIAGMTDNFAFETEARLRQGGAGR